MVKEFKIEDEVKMISAATEALTFARASSMNIEKIMKHISTFISSEKDESSKIAMVAAASKALSILERKPNLTDKEILREVMQNLKEITSLIQSQSSED